MMMVMVHTFPFNNISFATLGDLSKSSEWTISRRRPELTTFPGLLPGRIFDRGKFEIDKAEVLRK